MKQHELRPQRGSRKLPRRLGRGTAQGSQTRGVLVIDPRTGAVRTAGTLPRPLSDAGAATVANRILLVGGRDAGGQVLDSVYSITAGQSPTGVTR